MKLTVTCYPEIIATMEQITIRLTLAQRAFLTKVSLNGGEIDLDHDYFKDENPPFTIPALDKLVKTGALIRHKIISTGNKYSYKLTPIGINLVTQIQEREI